MMENDYNPETNPDEWEDYCPGRDPDFWMIEDDGYFMSEGTDPGRDMPGSATDYDSDRVDTAMMAMFAANMADGPVDCLEDIGDPELPDALAGFNEVDVLVAQQRKYNQRPRA
jgi:hypothetical protein